MKGLLDQNVTPKAALALNAPGHDFWHVRDRGLVGHSDRVIWNRATEEDRVLFTINHGDFIALAAKAELHCGLVLVPADLLIVEQCDLLQAFVAQSAGLDLVNRIVELDADGGFSVR